MLGSLDGRYKYWDYANGVFTLKSRSHLTSAFAFASLSKFNIASVMTQTQTQTQNRSEYILCVNVNLMVTFTPNAEVKCEQSITSVFAFVSKFKNGLCGNKGWC